MTNAQKLAESLGQIYSNPKWASSEFPDMIKDVQTDYSPLSISFCVENETLSAHKLTLVVAESLKTNLCAIMLCPKADILSAVMHTNILVRKLTVKTKVFSTLEIADDWPEDVDLEHSDPDFDYNRYLVARPEDFKLQVDPSFNAKFLVTTDDNLEGELEKDELYEAVKERTPYGITPLHRPQPSSLKPKTPSKTILRKKT